MVDLQQASDANLVVAIGRWHEQALAEVYRRHGGAVHALARRILRSDPPAEEITQEVFLDLWNHPEKFDAQRGTLRSFLLARTHGKSVDYVRSEVSRRGREEKTSRETATAGYDIDREVWDMAVAEQVQEALGALPDDLRRPIELAYFGGHTYREVAELLHEPEGTVKSRIRSGLGRLRVNLAERRTTSGGRPVNEHLSASEHREMQELLGVYALDAVDPETAAMIEQHLDGCVKCSAEVAQHHEVAGLLANSGGESPAGLWDGIAAQLDGSVPPSWDRLASRLEPGDGRADRVVAPEELGALPAPDGATVVPITAARRSRWLVRGAALVAAAAVIVALVLGAQVNHLNHQVSALQANPLLSAAEQAALKRPSTKQVQLTGLSSTPSPGKVTVVLTASGTGFVEVEQLKSLPSGRTYQLWGVIGGKTISLGLLGRDPAVVPFSVAGDGSVQAFAITAEQAGGVVQSANQPVVAGQVTA